MIYIIETFKWQGGAMQSQKVENFKKACMANSDCVQEGEYGMKILSDSAIIRTIIEKRDVKKYHDITTQLGKRYYELAKINGTFADIMLAALTFLPNATTVSQLMPLLKPFDIWRDEAECILRGMVESRKIKGVDLVADLDNIHQ